MTENAELRDMKNLTDLPSAWILVLALTLLASLATGQTPAPTLEASAHITWSLSDPTLPLEGYEQDGVPHGVWEWDAAAPWSRALLLTCAPEWAPVEGVSEYALRQLGGWARSDEEVDGWPGAKFRVVHGRVQVSGPMLRWNMATGQAERLEAFEATFGAHPLGSDFAGERLRNWPEHSVLSEGALYRIAVARDGVFRLGSAFWNEIGVDAASVPREAVTVFGNGGHLLPMANDEDRPLDPATVALTWRGSEFATTAAEGEFLFWAEGPHAIDYDSAFGHFQHLRNPYSDSAYYFVRIDDAPGRLGTRMLQAPGLPLGTAIDTVIQSTVHVAFHEEEAVSPNRSGREWYGEEFGIVETRTFQFAVPHALETPGKVQVQLIGRSIGGVSPFAVTAGAESATLTPNATSTSSTANVANLASAVLEGEVVTGAGSSARVEVTVDFSPLNSEARGWLDFIRVEQAKSLRFSGVAEAFFGAKPGSGWVQYELSNADLLADIWDVTDPVQPQRVSFELQDGVATFAAPRDVMRRFVAMPDYGFSDPEVRGALTPTDLHSWSGLDAVLITRPDYAEAALRWAALRADEGLAVGVAYQQQVFNEFSSGQVDPTAFKMLMMMLRDRAEAEGSNAPRFLQLMGDGTFANRGGLANSPYLITYQSANSLSPTSSYVSDDYFGFLEPGMGENIGDKMAIGVGRIPCSNATEALEFVTKLERYAGMHGALGGDCGMDAQFPSSGPWRNRITLVSDDMDGSGGPTELSHMMNSEEHAATLAANHPEYDVDKIYFDAYPQYSTPGGERYPDASDAIDRRVEEGALIVNYIGHGGERGWAHERVLTTSMIRDWSNAYAMPLFMTATCELARFDDPEIESAGELMVLNRDGGAVGMLTTTRVVFSSANQELNRAFYKVALEDEANQDLRLGDIARITKNDPLVSNVSNKRNFTLLGDAAMALAYPMHQVVLSEMPDSVRALELFEGRGYIADAAGDTLHGFQGKATIRVFDKRSAVSTLNNDGGTAPFAYTVFRNVIHQGEVSVQDGEFAFTFMVPRDIDYAWGAGRVSAYALDLETGEDAHGSSEDWMIGGVNADFELDTTPPLVDVYLNDTLFVSGGMAAAEATLLVRAFDAGGINSAGSGIGHQMKAVIDGDWAGAIPLNSYYTSDLDTYQRGTIRYPLTALTPGAHTIEVVMWDVQNNQGRGEVEFVVGETGAALFDLVYAYPNPATERVSFQIEHTLACEPAHYTLDVFDLAGRQVHTAQWEVESEGFRFAPLTWDLNGPDGSAVKPGTYVCRIRLETTSGEVAQQTERIVVLRP